MGHRDDDLAAPTQVRRRADRRAWTQRGAFAGLLLLVVAALAFVVPGVAPQKPGTPVIDKPTSRPTNPTADGVRIEQRAAADTRAHGWQTLPDSPLDPRVPAAAVWTGNEMIVWGGKEMRDAEGAPADCATSGYRFDPDTGTEHDVCIRVFADGAAYNPTTGSWRQIAPAPTVGRLFVGSVTWTGKEVIVWGSTLDPTPTEASDAASDRPFVAAYEAAADVWRVIEPYDFGNRAGGPFRGQAVWTGEEIVVWGGFFGNEDPAVGAAYDPSTDTWRPIAGAPIAPRWDHTAVWTGEEMIVWGGTNTWNPVGRALGAAAYDPVTDSWRRIAEAPIAWRKGHEAVWTGSGMLVWGGTTHQPVASGAAYDPATDTWRKIGSAPLAGRYAHTAVWTGERMLVWGGQTYYPDAQRYGDGAAYDPTADRWEGLANAPLEPRQGHAGVWTDTAMIVWGGGDCGDTTSACSDGAAFRPDRSLR